MGINLNPVKIETPSKVILFGEHAVVDGYNAISMAIDLKTYGKVSKNSDINRIIINLKNLNKKIEVPIDEIFDIKNKNYCNDLKYVAYALENTFEYLVENNLLNKMGIKPFTLDISSGIPVSCGLGSSASVVITTIKAILAIHGVELEKDELIKIAHAVEKEVQGKASITDTATITYGGMLKIKDGAVEQIKGNLNDIIKGCDFLIVYAEERKKKTAELVNEVANHPQKDEIFKSIGEVANKVESVKNITELGILMSKNHELLKELGVSTEKIDKVVEVGKEYGYGAKLTGAGGGGAVLILVDENNKKELLKQLDVLGVIGVFECRMSDY
ncbi:MAG: mevalonate kinase [Methanothermococcus sp.]|nr:mevalonate kinase [Methanothermococcus sp.]MDK2987312.1 mevalonate kinase [Methanothermococcus sp.]